MNCSTKDASSLHEQTDSQTVITNKVQLPFLSCNWVSPEMMLSMKKWIVPELSVDAIECQGRTKPFEAVRVESQAVDALKQGLHVGRALLLLLGGCLFD